MSLQSKWGMAISGSPQQVDAGPRGSSIPIAVRRRLHIKCSLSRYARICELYIHGHYINVSGAGTTLNSR